MFQRVSAYIDLYKKSSSIFNLKTKIEILALSILNLISGFLEVISIGSIPAFILFALNPEKLIETIPFEKLKLISYHFFNTSSELGSLTFVLFILVILFVFKNFFIFFATLYQIHFHRKIVTKLSVLLFNKYVSEKYEFFLENSPGALTKNLESCAIIPSIINMFLGIIKDASIILGLMFIISLTNLTIASIMLLFFILGVLIHRLKITKILKDEGKKSYLFQENKFSLINEFFGSVIDIKILNKENFFSNLFRTFIWGYETTNIVNKKITAMLRPFIEIVCIILMTVIIFYFFSIGKSFTEIIPIISLLSLSFIRMIPSSIMLFSYMNNLNFQHNQFNYLINSLNFINSSETKNKDKKKYFYENSLKLINIEFNYKSEKFKGVSEINLEINKNDQIGIIGKTGSGKSTLVNLICNLHKFSKGEIILNNEIKINKEDEFVIQNLHYIRQDMYLLNDTIKQNIAFGEEDKNIDVELVRDCLKVSGLNKYLEKLDMIIGNTGTKISGGEKQLLSLARALYRKPKLLILDEPTSNLDYKTEKQYLNAIKKLGITSVIVAHRTNTIENCNKVILLKEGKIIDQDTLENFKLKYQNLNNYID